MQGVVSFILSPPCINNALISFPLGSATCRLAGEGQHGLPSPRMGCPVTVCIPQRGVTAGTWINLTGLCFALGLGFGCDPIGYIITRVCHLQVSGNLSYIFGVTWDPQAHLSLHSANERPLSMLEVIR